ncbi:MAG: hypothetical protein QMC67_13685 [Candidatus Wallbacteria bacterium]
MNLKNISNLIHNEMKTNVLKNRLSKIFNNNNEKSLKKYNQIWKSIKLPQEFFNIKKGGDQEGTQKVFNYLISKFKINQNDEIHSNIINIINDVRYDYTPEHSADSNKKNFSTMLISAGIDSEILKESKQSPYEIPDELVNYCKILLLNYDSDVFKKLRNRQFEQVSSTELKEFVEFMEKLIYANVKDETKQTLLLNTLYFITSYNINIMLNKYNEENDQIKNLLDLILKHINHEHKDYSPIRVLPSRKELKKNNFKYEDKEIKEDKKPSNKKFLLMNVEDAFVLVGYLCQMIKRVAKQWEDVVYMMDEMRQEELSNIPFPEGDINLKKPIEINFEKRDKVFSESCDLLEKAIKEVNNLKKPIEINFKKTDKVFSENCELEKAIKEFNAKNKK